MVIEPGRIINDFIEPNKRQYAIPVYQRNYEWSKEQCIKLFEDIVAAYKRDKTHFCGSVVYALLKEEHNINYYVIIDGQQRLTTIYILLKALLDCAKTDEEKAMVKYRTPQEIMKELNDEELNNFRRYKDHLAFFPKIKNSNDNQGLSTEGNEEDSLRFSMDLIEDPNPEIYDSEYEDTCNLIRQALKPKQADIIISVVINEKPLSEYASEHGWSLSDASHRLSRAKKNLKNFLENRQL